MSLSGATITVTKKGPWCRHQGQYMQLLGEDVTPKVIRIFDDGYEMELLEKPPRFGEELFTIVAALLANKIWNRTPAGTLPNLESLLEWCGKNAPHLHASLRRVYPTGNLAPDGECLIHGDPTLSNVLIKLNVGWLLADPVSQAMSTCPFPNTKEVDIGKLLQSAIGWESVVLGVSAPPVPITSILSLFPPRLHAASVWWAACHLARAAKRAEDCRLKDLSSWAGGKSAWLGKEVEKLCLLQSLS